MGADARLADLKLELPPAPKPVATYVTAVRHGDLLYVSGHGPAKITDKTPTPSELPVAEVTLPVFTTFPVVISPSPFWTVRLPLLMASVFWRCARTREGRRWSLAMFVRQSMYSTHAESIGSGLTATM